MGRVAWALAWHEFLERSRDRWIIVLTLLFVLLSAGISLYGKAGETSQSDVVGPSLVTLASLLIPLVGLLLGFDAVVGERERRTLHLVLSLPIRRWEFIVAKFAGRLIPLGGAILAGILVAVALLDDAYRLSLLVLVLPSMLLGAAFLALGILISCMVVRQATASSLLICFWFLLVFFYDLGLLGVLVVTDGALSAAACARLVAANPVGLFRIMMIRRFGGDDVFAGMDLGGVLPSPGAAAGIWVAWIVGALVFSALLLYRRRERL